MDLGRASALYEPRKARCGERRATLRGENERQRRVLLALQASERAEFVPEDQMR